MNTKQRLESLGGTVAELIVNGITFFAVGFRTAGEVDVYDVEGEKVGNATLDDTFESAIITLEEQEGFSSSELYHENDGKTEYDLASDIGKYIATISFY